MYTDVKELQLPTDIDVQLGKWFNIEETTIQAHQGTSVTVITCGCGTSTCYGNQTCPD